MAALLGLVFLSGLVTGALVSRSQPMTDNSLGPYIERMTSTFLLSPKQERLVRLVLSERDRIKHELLEGRFRASLPADARMQLWSEDRRADRRIRAVLNPTQQNQYDAMLSKARD